MPRFIKRTASWTSPYPIGPQNHYSAPPGSGCLPLRTCQAPACHGTPGSMPHQDSCPLGLLHFRPHWTPTPHRTALSMLHQDPHPSGPAGPQLHMGLPDPHSTGIPASHALKGPSSTGLMDSCSTRHPHGRPQQEGSKPA
jgi:hypothetical protein